MGNNKGRSKGCVTCIQRRVKCGESRSAFLIVRGVIAFTTHVASGLILSGFLDQSRPICGRCSRGKFTCLGYRDTLFIDGGAQFQQRANVQLTSAAKERSLARELQQSQRSTHQIAHRPERDHQQNVRYNLGLYSCTNLSLSPWQDDIMLSYLVTNLGSMGTVCRELVRPSHHPEYSQQMTAKGCLLALATTFYGVGHTDTSIVDSGRRLYSRALTELNAALNNAGRQGMKETLTSVIALCLHEVATTPFPWFIYPD